MLNWIHRPGGSTCSLYPEIIIQEFYPDFEFLLKFLTFIFKNSDPEI